MSFFKFPTIGHTKKRRAYDPAQISLAYKSVTDGHMSVYKAARVYGIPESTLRDRHLGLQPSNKVPTLGLAPLLSREEEQGLKEHMDYMSTVGYGYSKSAFLEVANEYAVVFGKKTKEDPPFTDSWFQGFKGRWPEIHLVKSQKQSILRAKATSVESLNKHFSELKATMDQLDLHNHPERVWNVDETENSFEHNPPKVMCCKDSAVVSSDITKGGGGNVTVIGCGNAAGNFIPPYIVFPGKRWSDDLMKDTCPGAACEMSESGWSNSAIFHNYMNKHFLKFVKIENDKPHLIIFDGHKSHVTLSLSCWGKDHGVEFYKLPPHTSHATQPVDVAVFAPYKVIYHNECHRFMRENGGQTVSRYAVGQLVSKSYLKAFTPNNLVSAFNKTGIYPLNSQKISVDKTLPSSNYQASEVFKEELSDQENSPLTSQKLGKQYLEEQKIVNVNLKLVEKENLVPLS